MEGIEVTEKMRGVVFSKSFIPLVLILLIFLFIKHDAFHIRISDTNIYFYTALELLHGRTLYNEIFFTNLPLFPYISVLYGMLTGWKLEYFYAIPLLETLIAAFLIYKISFIHGGKHIFGYISSIVYLFSFLVLATSDHETGVFIANIFSLVAYYLLLKNKVIFSGIFLALTLLTKAYFLPIPIALILYLFFNNRNKSIKLTFSFLTTLLVLLLFFYIQSDGEILQNLLAYSSQRHQGVSKIPLLQFFVFKDFVIFVLLLLNLSFIKSKSFFGFLSFFSIFLVLFYQDVYFLYLNFFVPFVAISISQWLPRFYKNKNVTTGFFVLIFVSFMLNITTYLSSYKDLQKIEDVKRIVVEIQKQNPSYLYGINAITPALSYLSGIPMLDRIIDTNENRFLTGNLDATTLTKKALSSNALLVTKSALYPQYQINEVFMSAIFDKKLLSECTTVYMTPVTFEGTENNLSLVSCSSNKITDESEESK